MSIETKNIIHKQVIEIITDNVTDAQDIERRYKELIKQINTSSFENCFEDLLPPNQHLYIDRIEIDLGKFNKTNLFSELGTQLSFALREAIKKNISQKSHLTSKIEKSTKTSSFDRQHATLEKIEEGETSTSSSFLEGPFEIFVFFLEKGRLPNWAPLDFSFEEDQVQAMNSLQQVQLKTVLQRSEQALLRFNSQFSVSFINRVLENFMPVGSVFDYWRWVDKCLLPKAQDKAYFKKIYWSYVLSEYIITIQENAAPISGKAEKVLFKALKKLPESLLISMKSLVVKEKIPKPFHKHIINHLDKLISGYLSDNEKTKKGKSNLKSLSPIEGQMEVLNSSNSSSKSKTKNRGNQEGNLNKQVEAIRKEISSNLEPIWINDAGLVILAPFITELFKTCDFLDKGNFKSLEMKARAVNVFGYLAHGENKVPEYQKLLPKLFCGLLWETVLPETSPISDKEKTNADKLLKAVVNHWKALGNSSPEAIQEAFIRRPGKLILGNPALMLEVEQKTQDILLKKLPWGFSMIKLQWMPNIVQVKWI